MRGIVLVPRRSILFELNDKSAAFLGLPPLSAPRVENKPEAKEKEEDDQSMGLEYTYNSEGGEESVYFHRMEHHIYNITTVSFSHRPFVQYALRPPQK